MTLQSLIFLAVFFPLQFPKDNKRLENYFVAVSAIFNGNKALRSLVGIVSSSNELNVIAFAVQMICNVTEYSSKTWHQSKRD